MSRADSSNQLGPTGSEMSAGLRRLNKIERSKEGASPSAMSSASSTKAQAQKLKVASESSGPHSLRRSLSHSCVVRSRRGFMAREDRAMEPAGERVQVQ